MSRKDLKIIAWNVNSIKSKIKQEEVRYFLFKHKPHMLLLSETKLNNCNTIQFPHYKIYRNDRLSEGGGGTAILIKEDIKHEVVNTPLLSSSEATCVRINVGSSKWLNVISFYCPKNLTKQDLLKLTNLNSNVFMGGDFNAKHRCWHNSDNNNNGNILYKFLIDESVTELIHPDEYTCFRSKTNPSTIDFALTKGVKVASANVLELNPDHCPVEYILELNNNLMYETPVQHYMYHKADWTKFKGIITNELLALGPSSSTEDVDSYVEHLTKVISHGMTESIPKKCFTGGNDFSPDLKHCIERKKRLRRAYFRNKIKKAELKIEIRCLDKLITDRINENESRILMNKLKVIKPNHEMYKNINKLLNTGNKSLPALKANDGSLISNVVDKANLIAKEYEKIHKQNREMGDKKFNAIVESEVKSFSTATANTGEPLLTDADEIHCILKNIKNKKSIGPDTIPNIVLKKLPRVAHEFLAKLVNNILSSGYYPSFWKVAHVIPIPKPGKPANEAKNLRPISLLNNLSKIVEKVLHNRILNFCNENNLLPKNQFGFRNKHSTVHALLRLFEEAVMGFNDRKVTIAAFLDIEKAFDTMWVDGLIYKLIKMEFPKYLIKIILSYLKDRKFSVKLGDQLSKLVTVNDGVPQGSILGPLLFIIFMSDIPTHTNTTLSIFADDTNTFSTRIERSRAKSNVQSHLNKLQCYYQKWKIKVNVEKSEALSIQRFNHRGIDNINSFVTEMNNIKIPYKKCVRYLGYYVQSNLKHNEHINRVLLKAHTGLHKLDIIMKINNGVSQEVKIKTYVTILRPILTYAVAIWHNLPKYLIRRLKIFENKCLRMAINFRRTSANYKFISTENLHKITKTPRLNIHLYNLAKNTLSKTYFHENTNISKLGNFSSVRIANSTYKPPHSILWSSDSKLLSL